MTVESCVSFCNSQNYIYAGVEYAQECCECAFSPLSPSVLPFSDVFLTLPLALQIVEMSLQMARQVLQVRIAVSHAQAMRVRLVAPVIALMCIGVVRPLHLHLKSCQALDSGLH
jgi:hypothetical protein